jgi:hypothetical protein
MSVIDRDDPFLGRSILDLEGLRVQAEDELAAVEQAIPGSPGVAVMQAYLDLVTDEIAARGLLG